MVTNYHVIRGGDAFSLTSGDDVSYDGRVVAFDANRDVAVLRTPGSSARQQQWRIHTKYSDRVSQTY